MIDKQTQDAINRAAAETIGHPVTNMLMAQAFAADLGSSDHADGVGVQLAALDVTGHATVEEGGAGPVTGLVEKMDEVLGGMSTELGAQLLEIENLVEGARDAIAKRLEQFDQVIKTLEVIRVETEVNRIDRNRIEEKLNLILAHFGLLGS